MAEVLQRRGDVVNAMTSIPESKSVSALREQLSCYRNLQRLCELQRQYVEQNQTDELLTVLESRGGILNDIARLEQDVSPLKRDWPVESAAMTDDVRRQVQEMLAEAKLLLAQITQADQDDVLLLQQRKLNVGRQIAATSNARQVNNRYAASAYAAAAGSKLNVQK
ncbi:MAG: hypothetical protein H7144_09420 [Burkholderiales bacterium]|nr:hypothetical protein [Phycisphaerae bacterium]